MDAETARGPGRTAGVDPAEDLGAGAVAGGEYEELARYFDGFAAEEDAWLEKTERYHGLIRGICQAIVPPGRRVLEIGCGRGDLLAALEPAYGVGVDLSEGMIAAARRRHPGLEFVQGPAEGLQRNETFDYIVLCDLVPYAHDLQALFATIAAHSHPRTRIVISTYSNAWRPLLRVLTLLGMRPHRPLRNWVAPKDLVNLAELAGLEVVVQRNEILLPTRSAALSRLVNGLLARLPGLRWLTLTYWLVARQAPRPRADSGVSVIVPCRNEAGSIDAIVERVPEMGRETEIVFVEGGSTDDTHARIEDAIARRGDRSIRLVSQSGKGKWNAVQEGFAVARNEILMILDGDLTVAPEDLPKFYDALVSGRGELINGSRLVYGMEQGAMRFANLVGNKFFAGLLSFVLSQYVKDTLCGTKVLFREDYLQLANRRHELGAEDPFGDFDLLLGASLAGYKIANVPVRYGARVYGETNIQRFSSGGKLLRLSLAAFRRIWVRPVDRGSSPME
jgi:SAM-dependent methyltransferase